MHCLTHVAPLLVRSLAAPALYALLPVPMKNLPTKCPELLAKFVTPMGAILPLHEDDSHRVRKYMARYNTEALTSDGIIAFTLDGHGNRLLQCDPDACEQPPQRLFVKFLPQTWITAGRATCGAAEDVDVTDEVLGLPAGVLSQLRDGEPSAEVLVDPESRGHLGPYSVFCEAQICAFFGVSQAADITEAVIDAKRAGVKFDRNRLLLDLNGEAAWTLGVGASNPPQACLAANTAPAGGQRVEPFPGPAIAAAA